MKKDYESYFEQILAIADDIRKEPKSEIAKAIKQCHHASDIFTLHSTWRKSVGNEYIPKLNK